MPPMMQSLLCGVLLLPFQAAAAAAAAAAPAKPLASLVAEVLAGDYTATLVPGGRRTVDIPAVWDPSEEPSNTRVERVEVVNGGTRRRLAPGCDYSAIFDVTFSPSPAPAEEVRQAEAATEEALCMWADVFEPGDGSPIRLRIDPLADLGEPVTTSGGGVGTILAFAQVELELVSYSSSDGTSVLLEETPAQLRYQGVFTEEELDVEFDGNIEFNRDVDWHYGEGGTIGFGEFDYVTVMAHEIGHVLGFYDPIVLVESQPFWSEFIDPNGARVDNYLGSLFTLAMTDGNQGTPLTPFNFPTSLSTGTTSYIFTAGSLCFYDEPTDVCVPAYTPSVYSPGSSMSHFDEAYFAAGSVDSLMTSGAQESEVARCVGALTQRVFEQLGYVLSTDCRSTCASLITGETDPLDASCSSGGGASTTPAPVTSTTTSSPSTPAPAAPITGGERDNDLTPAPADANPAPGGLTTPAPAPITGGERDTDLTPAPVDQQQGEQGSADDTPAPVGLTTPPPSSAAAGGGGGGGPTTGPTEDPVLIDGASGQDSAGSSVSSNGLSALTLALCVSLASTLLVSHTHMSTSTL